MRMHNDYMAESMKNHPERLKGFISINPKFKKEAIAEIERCAKLGFSGIGELGPGGNGYDFNDSDFIEVVECANAYHLPINIHCGEPVGHPYPGKDMTSLAPLPGLILKYPDVTFILAHMGGGLPFYELNPRYHGKFKKCLLRYSRKSTALSHQQFSCCYWFDWKQNDCFTEVIFHCFYIRLKTEKWIFPCSSTK